MYTVVKCRLCLNCETAFVMWFFLSCILGIYHLHKIILPMRWLDPFRRYPTCARGNAYTGTVSFEFSMYRHYDRINDSWLHQKHGSIVLCFVVDDSRVWISNHSILYDMITYPKPTYLLRTLKSSYEDMSAKYRQHNTNYIPQKMSGYFTPHFMMDVITYPCWD